MKKHLITGAAGFIGFHLAQTMAKQGLQVIGLDNINDYYEVDLKYGRLKELGFDKNEIQDNQLLQSKQYPNLQFIKADLADYESLKQLFEKESFTHVSNLAAQAGVRYSLQNPHTYVTSNVQGFVNLLECCRHHKIEHLVYASSSSVYGLNKKIPFSTSDNIDHPVSLYAATKKSNELMAHTYAHLFGLPCTGLRFFTVYGPWGRPDMAYFLFTRAILEGKTIKVFNHGDMMRDFTYIDDIVTGIQKVLDVIPKGSPDWDPMQPNPSTSQAPYKIYNISNNKPVQLLEFIETIEAALGQEAQKEFLPMQPGDVKVTYADVKDLVEDVGYKPDTELKKGIGVFVEWYKNFY